MRKFEFKSRFNLILLAFGVGITVFTVMRIVFFILSLKNLDNAFLSFLWAFPTGFLYDLAFCFYANLFFALILFLIPERIFKTSFFRYSVFFGFVFMTFFTYFTAAGEWFFWEEFNVRFNFIAVDYLIYTREVVANIYQSYPVLKILAFIFVLALITVYLLRDRINEALEAKEGFKKRAIIFLVYVGITSVFFFTLGQGLRNYPENNYLKEISSNGPYQFIASFKNNELDYIRFYPSLPLEKISAILKKNVGKSPDEGDLLDISRRIKGFEEEKRKNVILISIESLSAEFLGKFGNTENLTPFLDTLADHSLFFTNIYATGTRTARGLEAITLSVPPTPGRSIVKRPGVKHIFNLGKIFEDRGYYVAFVYGGRGFFDNMNDFFSGCGYDIVDRGNFTDSEITFENAWGVCDGDLYGKTLKIASTHYEKGEKFFLHIMTTSNHRPYTYPSGKIDIPSGTGRKGAVKYTDFALMKFIENAKKQPWFKDTVFIITADHCASSAGKIGLPVERYHIPLFIYSPGFVSPERVDTLASQIDIAPTLLSVLGFNYTSHFFGNNILAKNFRERTFVSNYEKLGLFEDNELAILFPVKQMEIYEDPLGAMKKIKADFKTPIILDAIAYYEGSYYMFKHKLDRYSVKAEKQ